MWRDLPLDMLTRFIITSLHIKENQILVNSTQGRLRKLHNIDDKNQSHPNVERDLLMFVASFKRSPSAPELFCLYYQTQECGIKHKHIPPNPQLAIINLYISASAFSTMISLYLSDPAKSTRLRRANRWWVTPCDSHWKEEHVNSSSKGWLNHRKKRLIRQLSVNLFYLTLHDACEYTMRTTTSTVHVCCSYLSVGCTLKYDMNMWF